MVKEGEAYQNLQPFIYPVKRCICWTGTKSHQAKLTFSFSLVFILHHIQVKVLLFFSTLFQEQIPAKFFTFPTDSVALIVTVNISTGSRWLL